MASLLQGGREEETAAGDPRILGTLNVPVGAGKVAGWSGALTTPPTPPRSEATLGHPPPHTPYLARLGGSGLVLSITTRFLCFRAFSHMVTQRCHEPSVS